jgi:hypothetical protein
MPRDADPADELASKNLDGASLSMHSPSDSAVLSAEDHCSGQAVATGG